MPGMQLVVPRDDDRQGRCLLAMYVESVMLGLRTAESIADDETMGQILGEYSEEMASTALKVYAAKLLLSLFRHILK